MDRHAKLALTTKTKIKYRRLIPHLPHQKISLKSCYDRITNNTTNNINRYKNGHDAEKWLSSRWKLSAEQMQQIAWSDLKYVMTTSKATKQHQYTKIIHKMWAVNKRQFKWKQCSSPLCPFCQEVEETRTHLLQCQHPVSKTNRNTALINLRTKLQGISTSPLITNHILRCLHQFHNGFHIPTINVDTAKNEVEKEQMLAINYQIDFGIENLLSGALTLPLVAVQRHYTKTRLAQQPSNSQINFTSWNRSFITLLLDYSNELWQFRCQVMHDEAKLTRESTVRDQAVTLLDSLKKDPFRVPFSFRNLLNRSRHYLRTTHLRNVRSWINRINYAVELESGRRKNGVNDIRRWMAGTSEIETLNDLPASQYIPISSDHLPVENYTQILPVVNFITPVPN